MRKTLLIFLLLTFTAVLAACGSNLDRADGEWVCDGKATLALHPELQAIGVDPQEAESGFAEFTMSIDSKAKRLSARFASLVDDNEFTIISDGWSSLVFRIKDDRIHMIFTNDDSIITYSENKPDSKLVFTRKK